MDAPAPNAALLRKRKANQRHKQHIRERRGSRPAEPTYDEIYDYASEYLLPEMCPIEAGIFGRLVDNECRHGRLPGDKDSACRCWRGA